jgi:DNA-binding IclR family transcriptional regulator
MTRKIPDKNNPAYKAPAIEKAFRILSSVAESPHAVGMIELSDQLGFSKSTTHGIVHALLREGALIRDPNSRKLYLGPLLAELAFSNFYSFDFFTQVQPLIDNIRDQINETVFFGVRIRDRVMITAISEASETLKISASVGTTLPLLAGALGKAFLAGKPSEHVRQFIEKDGLPGWTKNSIVDIKTYLSELEKVRSQGYAVDIEEYIPGINAVSVAIDSLHGMPAAIWVVGMSGNLDKGRIKNIAAIMLNAAQGLMKRIDI